MFDKEYTLCLQFVLLHLSKNRGTFSLATEFFTLLSSLHCKALGVVRMEENHNAPSDDGIITTTSGSRLDSRTSQLNDLLNEKLEHAFHKQTSQIILHEIAKIAIEYDPIDLAHAVTRLPSSVRYVVYENLPDLDAKAIFIVNVTSNSRIAIFRHTSNNEIRDLVSKMPPDDAVEVLDDLTERRRRRVIELLDPKKAQRITELLKHGLDTAGRLMTNEFFAFPMNTTVGQAATQIHDNPGIELMRSIFVLNDEGELIGCVPSRNLIINPDHLPLKVVMRPVLHKVFPESTSEEVVDLVERYKIETLPVVDEIDRLLGVITYEDVVDVMEDITATTMASIGGTIEDVSEYEPLIKRFLWRAPWLLVTLCAGLITATGLAYFHEASWFTVVPFFVPLITGMSGNVGIQCSTLFVRGIALGEVSSGSKREMVMREVSTGALIGMIFGILCGVVVYLLNSSGVQHIGSDPLVTGVTVCGGVFGACMTATLLGSLSPLFFAHYKIDPAVASGPIVTAFNDVMSTFMYFLVAKVVCSIFF